MLGDEPPGLRPRQIYRLIRSTPELNATFDCAFRISGLIRITAVIRTNKVADGFLFMEVVNLWIMLTGF